MGNETISTVIRVLAMLQFLVLVLTTYLIRRNMKRDREQAAEYNERYEVLIESLETMRMETEEVKQSYEQAYYEYNLAINELSERIDCIRIRH